MNTMQIAGAAIALGVSLAAGWVDYRRGIIPNYFTFPALLAGVTLALAGDGWKGGIFAVASASAIALVPFVLFRLNAMGGGDVKLFAAIGALLGVDFAMHILMLSFILGAVWGIGVWIRRGIFFKKIKTGFTRIIRLRRQSTAAATNSPADEPTYIRFGPAIFVSTAAVLALVCTGELYNGW